MKKSTLSILILSSLLLVGCGGDTNQNLAQDQARACKEVVSDAADQAKCTEIMQGSQGTYHDILLCKAWPGGDVIGCLELLKSKK